MALPYRLFTVHRKHKQYSHICMLLMHKLTNSRVYWGSSAIQAIHRHQNLLLITLVQLYHTDYSYTQELYIWFLGTVLPRSYIHTYTQKPDKPRQFCAALLHALC